MNETLVTLLFFSPLRLVGDYLINHERAIMKITPFVFFLLL